MEKNNKEMPVINLGKEIRRRDGKVYSIVEYELGVVYHVYNSMDIVIRASQTSAFKTLIDMIDMDGVDEEFKKGLETMICAIMNLPLVVFTDADFTAEMALRIVDFLNDKTGDAESAELREETEEDLENNKLFENAMLAIDSLPKTKEELLSE